MWGKNEAGSPKLGASTRARKERSIGSWDGKFASLEGGQLSAALRPDSTNEDKEVVEAPKEAHASISKLRAA